MGTESNLERYSQDIEFFGAHLNNFLGLMGLPQDGILAPMTDRRTVINNLATVLERLPDEVRPHSVYVSKFAAACAIGLFDAALNYLWDETVKQLRVKVARFDLAYFYASLPNASNRRTKLATEADLEKIGDWDLVCACRTTGIITDQGFRHLEYVRDMRNHASAAHPNQNAITGLQIIGWLEICIIEVLAKEIDAPVIQVRRLLDSLRKEDLSEDDGLYIAQQLPSLSDDLSGSLLRSIVGMYTDTGVDTRIKDNIRLVAVAIWEGASEEARKEVGIQHAMLRANGEVGRAKLTREFIEVVKGQKYLSVTERASEMAEAADNLMSAHNGWHNFYNEPAPARILHRLVPSDGNIPPAVMHKYVKVLTMCSIGNPFGVSWAAERYYKDLLSRFADGHIVVFINLLDDPEVASRLQFVSCVTRYKALVAKLKGRAVRPRIIETLDFIEGFSGRFNTIASDTRYRQLRNTLRLGR